MNYNPDIIPAFNQADPKWGGKLLGTSGLKMDRWGCYVASTSMLCHNFGKTDDPGELVDKLNVNNGFVDGQLSYDGVKRVYSEITLKEAVWTTAYVKATNVQKMAIETALRRLEWFVRLGLLPILCVDNVLNDGLPDHAVVLYHAPSDRSEWRIKDPDGGRDVRLIDRYGPAVSSVFGYRLFVGPPINAQPGGLPGLGSAAWKAQQVAEGKFVTTYSKEIVLNILDTNG